MPPVALAPLTRTHETTGEELRPQGPTALERVHAVLADAHTSGRPAVLDGQTAADAEVLVERLRKLKARGAAFADLALGPALAALHVQARLAGM